MNLLGGRARVRKLHPLVSVEIGSFDPDRILAYGSLPPMHLSDDPWDDLRSYCGVHLQQAIAEEGSFLHRGTMGRQDLVPPVAQPVLRVDEALGQERVVFVTRAPRRLQAYGTAIPVVGEYSPYTQLPARSVLALPVQKQG